MEGTSVKRLYSLFGIGLLMLLLAACGGGGSSDDGNPSDGPLTVQLLRATPSTGSSPLRVTFTVNISGGVAPYYYSWDYTNDGSVDDHINQTFNRTLSVQNDYYIRASDVGGTSVYQCQLKVMDSSGDAAIVPDPLTVTVLSGSGMTFGEQTFWFTNVTDDEGAYIARTGQPVYFRAQPLGGQAPYSYQWDFNEDGQIDSTLANPEYTYTYTGTGAEVHKISLIVLDGNSEKAYYDYLVPVQGPPDIILPVPDFQAVLDSYPAANDEDVITLKWDSTGTAAGLPTEPQLDLSVIISQEANKSGVPPYEYYWDFENDGKYDTQVPSPTIPYYDFDRKITVNPYVHLLNFKRYTLRVMVIDSSGQTQQFYRTVVSSNIGSNPYIINADVDYGFGTAPMQPYVAVTSGDVVNSTHTAKFVVNATGSPGTYQYQFDADGDGMPEDTIQRSGEDPANPDEWEVPTSGSFTVNWPYRSIGFFAASMTIRTVDSGNNQIDMVTIQTPISIVKVGKPNFETPLDARTDAGMSAAWSIQAGGGNGQTIASREVVITGGRRGNTALRSNLSLRQTFVPPVNANEAENVAEAVVTDRLQINQERYNHWQWTKDQDQLGGTAQYYIMGGEYMLGGQLMLSAATEVANAANALASPWAVSYEMGPDGYLTLTEANGAYVGPVGIPTANGLNFVYAFVGGVMDRTGSVVNQVSRKFISFDPDRPAMMLPAYVSAGPDIPTGRYDGAAVYYNNRYYVIGGRVASGESVGTVEAYNLNTGIWENLPPLQEARSGNTACVIGGKIYVIGGGYYPGNESASTLVTSAEVYNPDTGTWSYTVAPTNVANNAAAAALPGPGAVSTASQTPNTIWYYGGEDAFGAEKNDISELVYYYTVLQPAPAV
jgi:hypothetical protein